jgi:alginate O-acetyltransferase complex protein AlgI
MIFNQFAFLFLFLPVLLIAFFLPGCGRLRPYALLGASFLFYSLAGIEHAVVLAVDVLWVYALAHSPAIVGNRTRLIIAFMPPILALVYYKYLGFIVRQVLGLELGFQSETFSLFADILLPAGISFFTFQVVSFAIDRYRGEVDKPPGLLKFALYISFFPQLVAGPIVRYHQIQNALQVLERFRPGAETWSNAIGYISIGLALKVLLADTLGGYQDAYVADPGGAGVLGSLFVVSAYSFQIYFDFYGYSLIAIGLGCLFGFKFPQNFDRPYSSLNPRDFWRRWHMTLSYWIRDYLYLSLGGNNAYVRNIVIVFAVCGLWHGAGWTFIVWGLYHGCLVAGYHFGRKFWDPLPSILQVCLTFALVSLGWVLFIFDFQEMGLFAQSLLGIAPSAQPLPTFEMWAFVALSAVVCFGMHAEKWIEGHRNDAAISIYRSSGAAVIMMVVLMFLDRSETFIYFRF